MDIHKAGPTTVQALKARADWWMELGDTLLLGASAATLEALAKERPLKHRFETLDPADLALQSRACGTDDDGFNRLIPMIAAAGRFALVMAPPRLVPYATAEAGDYFPAKINTIYAQELDNVRSRAPNAVDPKVAAVVGRINPQRWFDALTTLARYNRSSYGTEIDQARDWLGTRFAQLGLEVEQQTFSFNGSGGVAVSVENVIGKQTGTQFPDEWIVVGGHYDSRNTNNSTSGTALTPGAEDNASGCAGVLELARALRHTPPARSIYFMCYAGEEQGLFGGAAHAQRWQTEGTLSRLRVALIMDMIGYSGDADLDVLLETNTTHAAQLHPAWSSYALNYAPELRVVLSSNAFGSDHVPYLQRGRPSLLTIENDWDSYAHYHRSTDLPANVSNALAMGGAILKMNAAALAVEADTSDAIWRERFEGE